MNLYIFPTNNLLEQYNRNQDNKSHISNNYMTFDAFVDYVIKDITIGLRQISEIEKFFILKNVTNNLHLKYFKTLRTGYIKSIRNLIGELKLQGISYEDLKILLSYNMKNDDICKIYKSYQKYLLSGKLYDKEDRYLLCSKQNIEKCISKFERIIFYDFYDFTTIQKKIINNIGEKVVIINEDLSAKKSNIKIAEVKDRLTEIYNLAHQIIKDINSGYKCDDIAVIVRNPNLYSDYINEIFKMARIPLDTGYTESIMKNPFIKNLILFNENDDNSLNNTYFNDFVFDSSKKTFIDWIHIVKDILEFMGYPSYLLKATNDLKLFSRDIKAYNCLKEFIDIILNVEDKVPSDYDPSDNYPSYYHTMEKDEFINIFKDYLRDLTYSADGHISNGNMSDGYLSDIFQHGIKILTPTQLRGLKYKKLYLIGMLDGEYPKNFMPDWIIKDDERTKINTHGYNIDNIDILIKRERMSLDFILNATQELYISYPNIVEDGKSTLKSSFISLIQTNKNEEEFVKINFDDVFVVNNDSFKLSEHGEIKIKLDLIINDFIFSTTSMESYLQCPYKFFLSYILKLKYDTLEQFDATKEGSVYHQILRIFIENHKEGLDKKDIGSYYEEINTLLLQYMNNNYKILFDNDELYQLKIYEMSKMLYGMIDYELKFSSNNFRPYKTEFAFGENDIVKIGNMRIKGIIDRIDKSPDGRYIVYDYKKSSTPKNEDITEIRNIQMPVYIKAAQKYFSNVAGGAFISIKDAGIKTIFVKDKDLPFTKRRNKGILTDAEWDIFFSIFEDTINQKLMDMKNGIYCCKPVECPKNSIFSYCDYIDICRYTPGGD